jgi:outer membrane receptor protein involved in Fe transport
LLGFVEVMRNDGPWSRKEGLRRTNGVLTVAGSGKASGWSASLMAYDAHWHSTDQVPQRLMTAGSYLGQPFGRFNVVDPSDGGATSRSSLSAEWHDNDARGSTQVSAYVLHDTLKLFSNFTYFMDRPETGDQFAQQDQRHVFGLQASRSVDHSWGPFAERTEVGLHARHDRMHLGLFDAHDHQIIHSTRIDDVRETSLGSYAQTAVEFHPTLRGLLGLRADRLDAQVNSVLESRNTGSASQSLASPKLSLVFGPWGKTEFFLNAAAVFTATMRAA